MKYKKEALSLETQAQRLIDRGLEAGRDELIRRLSALSDYRLSGYIYPFRKPGCLASTLPEIFALIMPGSGTVR